MKKYQLTVTTREGTGRSASRRLRKAEKIPAILYGKHTKPETLAVAAPEFVKLLKQISGRAALIELKRDAGATALSFLQEVQRDPITDKYLHLDLQEVKENEKMIISVNVRVVGEAYGVKTEGGVLDTATKRLRIRTLPKDLPEFIEVDVTELKMGEALHVSGLKPVAGVEFLDAPGQPVVLCVAPPEEEAAPVAAVAAEGAAPAAGAAGAAAPAAGAAGAAAPAAGAAAAPAKGDAKAAAPAAGAKPAAPAKK
ncbi:50S ribosomal protein L25 [Lacunisphaera limnophila]|uniref:Large ribosomal subunit protein bL25 n=1 Tax=Lacunisphaera limnophila TaxID=1838286 RepID=A0A1D8AZU4_9BACT|nr:50S ribosomal protein L25 [Lacunisphaera limnophila]AOS46387.1 50S ribosomal protein L25 [Lacunisphaera limnophila]